MNNPTLDLITEYNAKALENLKALGELNVATADSLVKKQVELSNSLFGASLASSKDLAAVKTPADAVEVSSKLVQLVAATVTSFVKDATASTLEARGTLKTIIDDSYALNSEYSGTAFDAGVEKAKKAAKKAA